MPRTERTGVVQPRCMCSQAGRPPGSGVGLLCRAGAGWDAYKVASALCSGITGPDVAPGGAGMALLLSNLLQAPKRARTYKIGPMNDNTASFVARLEVGFDTD